MRIKSKLVKLCPANERSSSYVSYVSTKPLQPWSGLRAPGPWEGPARSPVATRGQARRQAEAMLGSGPQPRAAPRQQPASRGPLRGSRGLALSPQAQVQQLSPSAGTTRVRSPPCGREGGGLRVPGPRLARFSRVRGVGSAVQVWGPLRGPVRAHARRGSGAPASRGTVQSPSTIC